MADNKTIHFIPPLPPKREKRVGIYCRVSTNSAEQLKSLTAQVSALTRLTAVNPKWLLVDVYIDIASGKTGSSRKEFTRMLKDCQSHDLEIILTKSISRFGRDTVEILDALNQLKLLGNDYSTKINATYTDGTGTHASVIPQYVLTANPYNSYAGHVLKITVNY